MCRLIVVHIYTCRDSLQSSLQTDERSLAAQSGFLSESSSVSTQAPFQSSVLLSIPSGWPVLQACVPPFVHSSVVSFTQCVHSSVGQFYTEYPSFCPFLVGQFYTEYPSFCPFLRWSVLHRVSLLLSIPPVGQFHRHSPHSFHSSSWPVFQTCAALVQADRNESSRTARPDETLSVNHSYIYMMRAANQSCRHRMRSINHSCRHRMRSINHSCRHRMRSVNHSCRHRMRSINQSCRHRMRSANHSYRHRMRSANHSYRYMMRSANHSYIYIHRRDHQLSARPETD